ncbi:hypothetical protein [Candidatus Palauibacter sp.]|uniref:hypothetical protein n=1 Tax=Candidatus Palauibacter sp. TaxID=3101350 RepID=UPI003B524212
MTVTAADGQATAAQGFNVTVQAAATNQAPVAVGTIPGSTLDIGGTSTIDVAGYFSDADGDELTYAGASSNESVATVAMEGSTATITAIASGNAVITVTASDGSASVSQGFRVDVADGPKAATVAIFGLRSVTDRTQTVDPTDVSGDVSVLLDVQWNDDTPGGIDLMLGDEVINCRGTSSDQGLAEAGAQVEVDCFFNTDAVMGECTGMQLDPMYANGDHTVSARLRTADGEIREAAVGQPITLNNSNYVMLAHSAGSESLVVSGLTFYGGPAGEDGANMNSFHACPVAYDGTTVGEISLKAMVTGPGGAALADAPDALAFFRRGLTPQNGVALADKEAPFTWTANPAINGAVENTAGKNEHWVINSGDIKDDGGLLVTDKFRHDGDDADELPDEAKAGPFHFDFKAPQQLGSGDDASEVQIGGAPVGEGTYYSDRKSGRPQTVSVSNVTEMGSGGAAGLHNQVIAVGDCSVAANADVGRAGAGTPFVAVVDDANVVGDIPEDDAVAGELSDDGGVDCYVAELQSLTDPLGNSRSLADTRIRSAGHFGVDRTAPVIDDQEPDEVITIRSGSLTFQVEDPDLETGEAGTGVNDKMILSYAGGPAPDRRYSSGTPDYDDGLVTISSSVGRTGTDGNGRHTVTALVPDNASPPNYAVTSFTFIRDTKAPTFVVSKSQSDIGFTNSPSVLASVGGVISDLTVIEKAELSIRKIASAGAKCAEGDTLSQGRTGRVARNKRDLENDTNSITFDETFTIRKPTAAGSGPERYCFLLDVEDSATESDGRGDGNPASYTVGEFAVQWPAGPTPPPAGPTFKFHGPTGNATERDSLGVVEGATENNTYRVTLDPAPTAATAYPITLTIDAPATVTTAISAGTNGTAGQFAAGTDTLTVTVTTAHDLNIDPARHILAHKATGFGGTDGEPFVVNVTDDDFAITVDTTSVREDDDAEKVLVTLTAGSATATAREVSIDFAAVGPGADAGDFVAIPALTMTIPAGMKTDTATVEVDATDDGNQDEQNEFIELTVSGSEPSGTGPYYAPARIEIMDDDPDIKLSLSQSSAGEAADAVALTITATAKSAVSGIITATVTIGNPSAAAGEATRDTDFTGPASVTLTIDAGATGGTATTTVTIVDDGEDDDGESITFTAANVTIGDKAYTFGSVKLAITDNDDTP